MFAFMVIPVLFEWINCFGLRTPGAICWGLSVQCEELKKERTSRDNLCVFHVGVQVGHINLNHHSVC